MNPNPILHARLRADLKAFADHELPPFARFAVARHLRGCGSCREELHNMKTLSHDLRENEAETQPLSDELRAHILDQVPEPDLVANEEIARRQRRVARKKMVLALGTCALAGIISFSALQNTTRNTFNKVSDSMSASDQNGALSDSSSGEAASPSAGHNSSVVVGGVGNPPPPPNVSSANSVEVDRATGIANDLRARDNVTLKQSRAVYADGHVKAQEDEAQRFALNNVTRRRSISGASAATDSISIPGDARAANPAFQSVVPPSRVVHREGSVTVAVSNAESASDNATAIIRNAGGFVASVALETGAGQKRTATLDCRVPVEQFETVVQKIGQLGTVRAKSLSGQDITAQVARVGAQREAWSQELSIAPARLRKIEGAKKTEQGRIAQSRADVRAVRLQAAQARAQLETLKKYGSLSSLYVSLQDGVPVAKTAGWTDSLSPTTRAAWDSFGSNARLPLQFALWILAYSPLWLPTLLIWRKYGRKWLEA